MKKQKKPGFYTPVEVVFMSQSGWPFYKVKLHYGTETVVYHRDRFIRLSDVRNALRSVIDQGYEITHFNVIGKTVEVKAPKAVKETPKVDKANDNKDRTK